MAIMLVGHSDFFIEFWASEILSENYFDPPYETSYFKGVTAKVNFQYLKIKFNVLFMAFLAIFNKMNTQFNLPVTWIERL